jgi:hypothetical protein
VRFVFGQERGVAMAEGSRNRPWRFAVLFTLVVFSAFSLLPVWTASYFSSWEEVQVRASFWTMLASLPPAAEQVRARELVLGYGPEVIKLVVLLGAGLGVGRWLAGRSRAR